MQLEQKMTPSICRVRSQARQVPSWNRIRSAASGRLSP